MVTSRMIKGKLGEQAVADYMSEKGYNLCDRNFNCRRGELDLVMELDDEIAIIEVKTRTSNKYGTPAESVTYQKQMKIRAAADFYIQANQLYDRNIVFYVAAVMINSNNIVTDIEIIRNAF